MLLLGIGVNGHVGFNEPGTPFDSVTVCVCVCGRCSSDCSYVCVYACVSLTEPQRVVELTAETRQSNARFFDGDLSRVPTHAVTMGLATIAAAHRVRLLATGAGKAAIIARVMSSPPIADVPATALHTHAALAVHLDRAAAALLK